MKNVLLILGGVAAAAVGFLVWNKPKQQPVQVLAHKLEEAWADHHTVA